MPWLIQRNGARGPKFACLRCGKLWYDYHFYISSPITGFGSFSRAQYEGQPAPYGHESWTDYHRAIERGRKELLTKIRKESNVGKSRYSLGLPAPKPKRRVHPDLRRKR